MAALTIALCVFHDHTVKMNVEKSQVGLFCCLKQLLLMRLRSVKHPLLNVFVLYKWRLKRIQQSGGVGVDHQALAIATVTEYGVG